MEPTFGEKLKIFRVSLPGSPSLEKFGEVMGANKATLSRYESGDTEPTVSFLQRLVEKYGRAAAPLIPGVELLEKAPVTAVLPLHIESAWLLIHKTAQAGGVDLMAAEDQKEVGEAIATIAEGYAQGPAAEGENRLARLAEKLLRALGR